MTVAIALVVLASAVVAGLPASALAQTAESTTGNESATTVQATNESWSTHRADDGRTGSTDADGPAPYGDVTWNDSFSGEPAGAPAIVDDTAYLAVTTGDDGGYVKSGGVVAYDRSDGHVRWERTDLGATHGSPTVANDTVYVSTEGIDPEQDWATEENGNGGLYALDAETGETQWARNDTEFWLGTAVHADGLVYATREPETDAGNASLVALDSETGETVWSKEADGVYGITDGTVYGFHDGDLFAAEAATGERTWSVDASTVGDSSHRPGKVAVTDDGIYAVHSGPNGRLLASAYSPVDGSTIWNVTVGSDTDSYRPAVTENSVFVATTGNAGELVRFDASTGVEEWRYEPNEGSLKGAPTVANDTVYVSSRHLTEAGEPGDDPFIDWPKHAVIAVDRQNGTQQWGYVTGAGNDVEPERVLAPSVVDGALYLASYTDDQMNAGASTGYVHALESAPTEPGETHRPSDGVYEEQAPVLAASISVTEDDPDRKFGNTKNVTLEAGSNSVRSGNVTTYEWDLDDDGTFETTGETANVALDQCEFATVTLRVTTDEGEAATDSVTLSNG